MQELLPEHNKDFATRFPARERVEIAAGSMPQLCKCSWNWSGLGSGFFSLDPQTYPIGISVAFRNPWRLVSENFLNKKWRSRADNSNPSKQIQAHHATQCRGLVLRNIGEDAEKFGQFLNRHYLRIIH